MTNLVFLIGWMMISTNRVESIYPSGEGMTVVETVAASVITPIAFEGKTMLVTNVVVLRTNSTDLVQKEVKLPYPPGFAGSQATLKVWRKKPKQQPKPALRDPRDVGER